jgi:DAK2 domain fusion protein YloV
MLRYAQGESLEYAQAEQIPSIAFEDIHGPDDFGYCTNFILRGQSMPFDEVRTTLAAMGQSAVIVGDDELIKAHVHLLRPGDALNYAVGFGALEQIEITNMDRQREELHQQKVAPAQQRANIPALDTTVAVVAVAPGPGFADIFRSLHAAEVVGGGQTMNPSTEDLLEAIRSVEQHDVIVLPNNGNVIMAARQTAALSDKRIEVLPTKTAPQGIAALLGFNFEAGIDENLRAMGAAMGHILTGEITTAVRDATADGVVVRAGQTIGLLDGDLVIAADEPAAAIDDLLGRMELYEREIVTIYYGDGSSQAAAEALAARIQERFADLEVEVQSGGQPLYEYIISAE